MPKLRTKSHHEKEPNTTTTEDKVEMLQTYDKIRRDFESLVGHFPEFDQLWVTREDIETRSEAVLEDWKRKGKRISVLLSELKKQNRPQAHYMRARLRNQLQIARISSLQSNASPPEKYSETMRKVEVECDQSIKASESVEPKTGHMFLKRFARLSICTSPKSEPAEDNTEEVKLFS